ncbi:MAG: hypothetical protein BACC_03629 [Bacteroides sp.]|uniref:phage portal protein n=1 Tax=Bacteroides sp. TaxID=29523 RepID=UPI003034D4A0
MSWSLFKKKSENELGTEIVGKEVVNQSVDNSSVEYAVEELFANPYVCNENFLQLFHSVPEVFFPIDYIASRIAGATFNLKKVKDDSIVWDNEKINKMFNKPNCLFSWKESVYSHFVYKLCLGDSFIRAVVPDVFQNSKSLWKMCSSYWVLPSDKMEIVPIRYNVPLFGVCEINEIVDYYNLNFGWGPNLHFNPHQIFHDREGIAALNSGRNFLRGTSRLKSQMKPISNLIAVYEARNVIYVKRGGLGWLVSAKKDDTGTIAMTPEEKKELLLEHNKTYGIGKGQFPFGVSNIPLEFLRTNLSIQELLPFEETLIDAISIAGAFGIPSELVPRKDRSTFDNQKTVEKNVYSSILIPWATDFCKGLTELLGLENDGLYIDCDFSHVDCLQEGKKEAEDVHTSISKRCREEFLSGIITLNDWRAQIGESKVEIPLYSKLIFEMSPDEIEKVKTMLNLTTKSVDGKLQKPSVQDEGK